MSADPRIERMAQVIHDAHVHIHPDAPQAIKDARGKPTRADIEAAMRIYESVQIRRDLAETDLPDGSDWLAARDARVRAETLEDLATELASNDRIFLTRNGITSLPMNTRKGAAVIARARAAEYREQADQ